MTLVLRNSAATSIAKGQANFVDMQPSVRLEPFSEADFERLIAWSPTPEFLLQWAGPLFTFPLNYG